MNKREKIKEYLISIAKYELLMLGSILLGASFYIMRIETYISLLIPGTLDIRNLRNFFFEELWMGHPYFFLVIAIAALLGINDVQERYEAQ